jgi:hypothetical protein
MFHVWQMVSIFVPEGRRAIGGIGRFASQAVNGV